MNNPSNPQSQTLGDVLKMQHLIKSKFQRLMEEVWIDGIYLKSDLPKLKALLCCIIWNYRVETECLVKMLQAHFLKTLHDLTKSSFSGTTLQMRVPPSGLHKS